jgi:hypothetical protein
VIQVLASRDLDCCPRSGRKPFATVGIVFHDAVQLASRFANQRDRGARFQLGTSHASNGRSLYPEHAVGHGLRLLWACPFRNRKRNKVFLRLQFSAFRFCSHLYERQMALKENQISILLGRNAGPVTHTTRLLDQVVPPDIPVGLPSALLERRPDVLVAEQQVRAANAQVGVATANFFPQLGLTALLGQASTPLSAITSGQANVWSVAATFTGPIYQGGALRAQKRQAVAQWEQSKLQYELAALNAFTDVANALISRQKYEAIRTEELRSVSAYQEAVKISLQRYQAGKASYFEVLDAQIQLYPAENSLAQTELNRRVVMVQLYRALGGRLEPLRS